MEYTSLENNMEPKSQITYCDWDLCPAPRRPPFSSRQASLDLTREKERGETEWEDSM